MDLEGIMISEISQTEKDKYHMISLTCGILKKKQIYREEIGGCLRQGLGMDKMGKQSQKVQISSYTINTSWDVMYNAQITINNNTVLHI